MTPAAPEPPPEAAPPAPRQPRAMAARRALSRWAVAGLALSLAALLALYQTLLGDVLVDGARAAEEALPRLLLAVVIVLGGVVLAGAVRVVLRRALPVARERRAVGTVVAYGIYALAALLAVAVAAGQLAGLAISLGLVGFGLTLALQNPILSAVGWLTIHAQRLYVVGDRVRVGEVRGDVIEVRLLTTTLWEFGGEGIRSDLPSGRRVTIANKLVLEQAVVNYSVDFPYLWDELAVPVALEADWKLARELLLRIAEEVVGGERMARRVAEYEAIMARSFTPYDLPKAPAVHLRMDDSWLTMTLRYLVHIDERTRTRTRLVERVLVEFAAHPGALPPVYPRVQPMRIDASGRPMDPAGAGQEGPGAAAGPRPAWPSGGGSR